MSFKSDALVSMKIFSVVLIFHPVLDGQKLPRGPWSLTEVSTPLTNKLLSETSHSKHFQIYQKQNT